MILLTLFSSLVALAADPVFERLAGDWVGAGARVQYNSGRETRVEMRVRSVIEGDRLVTRNKIRETNAKGEVRVYEKSYWIRSAGASRYELGSGEDKIFARGTWSQGAFAVTQKLGGEPPYAVYSETRFTSPDVADYDETFFIATQELARTRIHFTRSTHPGE